MTGTPDVFGTLTLLMGLALTVFGTAALLVLGWQWLRILSDRRATTGWPRVPGTVVTMARESWTPPGSLRGRLRVIAYYSYPDPVSGAERRGKDVMEHRAAGPGTPVTVAVDPAHTGGSRLDLYAVGTQRVYLTIFAVVFGVIAVVLLVHGVRLITEGLGRL